MKYQKRICLLLVAGLIMFAAAGCGKKQVQNDMQMLVVERQDVQFEEYDCSFLIDIPLYGPQPLMDSLKVFLNKKLYQAFDGTFDSAHFSEKELFQEDLTTMLSNYADTYKPYVASINYHNTTDLLLIAQTESFVTYGLEICWCGVNCSSVFFCYTFDKKDGHLCDIIDREKLAQFIEDHDWEYRPLYDDYTDHFSFGLLEDSILYSEREASNHHYMASCIETQEIFQYLTNEAQQLINTKGDYQYSFKDWSLGNKLGTQENADGDTIILMQPSLWWGFEEDESELSYCGNYQDMEGPEVNAYIVKDGRYVRLVLDN